MSDSENENIFSYPNVNTTVSAKGPNTNISNLSIRQQLTSTMYNMPRNYERQRYAQSVCGDQRSMYRRDTSPMSTRSAYLRETSPMSIRSACDMRPYNFQPYYSGMNSQSMYHGRSGSPVSMRSIDSSASVSAKDIAFAFKNAKFNSHDIQIIKHAYRNLMKFRTRERFERKRNLRVFLKGTRKSGDDSGEQASDSSISGDDCRSAKTTISKLSNTQFDFSNSRRTAKDNNIRDCTDIRQNKCKNMFSLGSANISSSLQSKNSALTQNNLLKDRFKSSFLLPSQRFNQSVASTIIPEKNEIQQNKNKKVQNNVMQKVKNHLYQRPNNINSNTDSEDDQIFSETVKENTVFRTESQNKRSLGEDELNLPYNKRKKISSPIKNTPQNIVPVTNNNNKIMNNFEFIKPTLPAKKGKPKIQEKLISKSTHPQETLIAKSSQPLTDIVEPALIKPVDNVETSKKKTNTDQTEPNQQETMDNTDVSMRPSFIKRKLFTQKLDVIEKSNLSSDSVNSPQSSAYSVAKEKNKTRKLVTTQSCLNREVQDDNNLLDLIHKIVPPDQMNATSQSSVNLTKPNATKPIANETKNDDDKWDITSVISMCNDDDCSDTYTDEEIFQSDNKIIDVPKATKESIVYPCSVDLIKMPIVGKNVQKNNDLDNRFKSNDVTTHKLQNCAKSFWDTDTESDFEWPYYKNHIKENQRPGNITKQQETKNPARNLPSIRTAACPDITKSLYNTDVNTTINSTIDNVQKLKVANVSFRSHRLYKKKICCNETCVNDAKSAVEPQKKILIDISKPIRNPQKQTPPKSTSKSGSQNKNKITKDKTKLTEVSALTKDKSASDSRIKTKAKPDGNKAANNKSKSNTHNRVEKNVKPVRNKSPKTKATKAAERNNNDTINKNTNTSNPPIINSALDSTVESVQNDRTLRQRPMRSCRATSQNRSIDASKSLHMANNSCFSKSLRSRTINNLSTSSIENTTLHIKPRSKAVNKTMAQINSRKSDISFSLGNKNINTPIKMVRNRGKR